MAHVSRREVIIGIIAGAVVAKMPAGAQTTPNVSVTHEMVFNCMGLGLSPAQCSDLLLARLGHGPNFTLRADRADDTVHGAVMIRHEWPPVPHIIRVELYQADELPRGNRQTVLK